MQQQITETVYLERCPTDGCHAMAALASTVRQKLFDNHQWFYCAAGHEMHFTGQNEAEKKLDEERRRYEALLTQERRRREESERQAAHAETMKIDAQRKLATERRTTRRLAKVSENAVVEKGEMKDQLLETKKKLVRGAAKKRT